MFTYGSQINPNAGRSDFGGILQGGLARAQGEAAKGQAIGQGIASLGQSIGQGIQKYQQNQVMINDAIGKFSGIGGLLQSNPNLIEQAPEQVGKAAKKLSEGKTLNINEAALLSSFSDQVQKRVQQSQIEEINKIRIAEAKQQMARQQTDDTALRSALSQFDRSAIAAKALQGGAKFEDLSSLPEPPQFSVNAVVDSYLKSNGSAESLPRVIATANALAPKMQDPLDTIKKRVDIEKTIAETNKLQGMNGKVLSMADYQKMAKEAKSSGLSVRGEALEDGTVRVTAINSAGTPLIQGENSWDKARAETFKGKIDADIKSGVAARAALPAVNRLVSLFESGEVGTGPLAEIANKMRAIGKDFGIPIDEAKLKDTQEAKAYAGRFFLQYIQDTKGSISDKENAIFQSLGPELPKDKETNIRLAKMAKTRFEHDREVERLANKWQSRQVDEEQYFKRFEELQESYDKKLEALFPAMFKPKLSENASQYLK